MDQGQETVARSDRKEERLMAIQADIFEMVAYDSKSNNAHRERATQIVDLMTTIMHTTIVMLGHRYDLTTEGKGTPGQGGHTK